MKVIAPNAAPEVAGGNARSSSAYALQWRKALEDAQWQARARTAPHGDGEAATREALKVSSGETMPARARGGGQPPSAPTPARATLGQHSVRLDRLTAAVVHLVLRTSAPLAPLVEPSPVAPSAVQQEAYRTVATPRAAEMERAPPPTLFYEMPEWPEVVVHASVQGSAISVGMRDRALQKEDAIDLYYRLRAQLLAAGLTLASLTVNGHDIAPERAAAPQNT